MLAPPPLIFLLPIVCLLTGYIILGKSNPYGQPPPPPLPPSSLPPREREEK
jgi:hypothetical protein